MRTLPSTDLLARITFAWAVLFSVIHAYWAAGGPAGMNGDPADTPASQGYIAFITVLGILGAVVAHGLLTSSRSPLRQRNLFRLARAGGLALLAGVVVGTGRWIADGGVGEDGAAGVVTTAYFLLGGLLYSSLAWSAGPRLLNAARAITSDGPAGYETNARGAAGV